MPNRDLDRTSEMDRPSKDDDTVRGRDDMEDVSNESEEFEDAEDLDEEDEEEEGSF